MAFGMGLTQVLRTQNEAIYRWVAMRSEMSSQIPYTCPYLHVNDVVYGDYGPQTSSEALKINTTA